MGRSSFKREVYSNATYRKQETYQIENLTLYHNTGKEGQTPQNQKEEKIIKIRAEINAKE